MLKIIIIGVVVALIDVAFIWILEILNWLPADSFNSLVQDSLAVIGILTILGLAIRFMSRLLER